MRSRHSSRYSLAFKTSSAIARLQALADVKVARERTQFTRLIAEKELDHRTRETETQKNRQQEMVQFESFSRSRQKGRDGERQA